MAEAGLVVELDFDRRLGATMERAGRRLSDWTAAHDPPLPEDLCFYRDGDDVPAFFSLTHEREYWLLSERRPHLRTWFEEPFDPASYFVLVGRPRFLPESARAVDAAELARLAE